MNRSTLRRVGFRCCVLAGLTVLLQTAMPTTAAEKKPATSKPAAPATAPATKSFRSPERIASARVELEKYYSRIYGGPLRQNNRMAQLVGVMSLSRVDAAPLTEALIGASEMPDPLVAQFAWEAVYARRDQLTDAQGARWVAAGFKAERRGAFPGSQGLLLLAAARSFGQPIDPLVAANIVRRTAWTQVNESETAAASAAAAKKVFAGTWDGPVVSAIVARVMTDARLTEKVAAMLGGLEGAPAATGTPPQVMAAWRKYAEGIAAPAATQPAKVPSWFASARFAKPVSIDDPFDPKWMNEVELPPLKLGRLDVFYAIDSTGSMNDTNQLLAGSLLPLTRALAVCYTEIRIGTIYYRHEVDPAVQQPCCKNAAKEPGNHQVLILPLRSEVEGTLERDMKAFKIDPKAGHFKGNGAYCAALQTMIAGVKWTPGDVKRLAIVIGDAVPTEGSLPTATAAANKLHKDGTSLFFLSKTKQIADAVGPIADAGGGNKPILFAEDMKLLTEFLKKDQPIPAKRLAKSAIGRVAASALADTLPKGYADRVPQLMQLVLENVEAEQTSLPGAK